MDTIKPMPRAVPLMTAKQFERLGSDFIGELWDGVCHVGEASGVWPSAVGARIVERLSAYVRRRGLGWVFGENAGFHVRRNPDRVLSPDVAFVSAARLPEVPERGFLPFAPDFVVEVRSPSDSWLETVKKGGIWLAHDVALVWCVDPPARRVAVMRQAGPTEIVGAHGTLRAHPVLPRFRLPVEELFRNPG
jgi:Uma2 family endonuclease